MFNFSKTKHLKDIFTQYPSNINPNYVQNHKQIAYLKGFGTLPINSFNLVQEINHENKQDLIDKVKYFFSEKHFFQYAAKQNIDAWHPLINQFLKYPEIIKYDPTLSEINGIVDSNLMIQLRKYAQKIQNSDIYLQNFGQNNIEKIELEHFCNIQGVSMERHQNKDISQYIKTLSSDEQNLQYSLITSEKKKGKYSILKDKIQEQQQNKKENNEQISDKDLINSSINTFLISVLTSQKINIMDKRQGDLLYGSEDQNLKVKYLFQIETKKDLLTQHPFVITDVNFLLNGNPHIQMDNI